MRINVVVGNDVVLLSLSVFETIMAVDVWLNQTLFDDINIIVSSSEHRAPWSLDKEFAVNLISAWKSGVNQETSHALSERSRLTYFDPAPTEVTCSYCDEMIHDQDPVYVIHKGRDSIEFQVSCFEEFVEDVSELVQKNSVMFTAMSI